MRHTQIAQIVVLTGLSATMLLTGCSHAPDQAKGNRLLSALPLLGHSGTVKDPKVSAKPTLPTVDLQQEEKFTDRFKPHGFSLGSWIMRPDNPEFIRSDGPLFEPVPALVKNNVALVYFYRPDSRWNRQEILAPNFFLNTMRLPSLINSHYYWLELPAGEYRLLTRRPIGVVNFQKGHTLDFKVEAGKTYYLRYDEERTRPKPDDSLGLISSGPFQQVTRSIAMEDLRSATLNTPGYSFVANPDLARNTSLPSFNGQPLRPVASARVTEKTKVVVGVPLKLWNPLTW